MTHRMFSSREVYVYSRSGVWSLLMVTQSSACVCVFAQLHQVFIIAVQICSKVIHVVLSKKDLSTERDF